MTIIICKYINVFYNIHEDEVELSLFTNNIMDIYRERLVEMYNENKKKKNISVTDYIMEYQGLLFEVNAFLPTKSSELI